MDESINTANNKQNIQKPPLSNSRIAGEILAGMGMVVAVYLLVGCIKYIALIGGIGDGVADIAYKVMFDYVAPLLYGLASAVGVYLFGSRGKQTGSFLVTLAFGFIAGLFMLVIDRFERIITELMLIRYVLEFFIPTITATIGFNLTRKYKDGKNTIDESITTANKMQNRQKPPLSIVRIAGEILAGTALGFVVLYVVYMVGIVLFGGGDYTGSVGQLQGLGILAMFFLVFPPLAGLSRAVGVYLVGRIGKQTGSFLLTLGCGLLDGLSMYAMYPVVMTLGRDLIEEGGTVYISRLAIIVLFIPPLFAILGFNLTRKYKVQKKQSNISTSGIRITLIVLAVCSIAPVMVYIGSYGLIIPVILLILALRLK